MKRKARRTENDLALWGRGDGLCEKLLEILPCTLACAEVCLDVDIDGETLVERPSYCVHGLGAETGVDRRENDAWAGGGGGLEIRRKIVWWPLLQGEGDENREDGRLGRPCA